MLNSIAVRASEGRVRQPLRNRQSTRNAIPFNKAPGVERIFMQASERLRKRRQHLFGFHYFLTDSTEFPGTFSKLWLAKPLEAIVHPPALVRLEAALKQTGPSFWVMGRTSVAARAEIRGPDWLGPGKSLESNRQIR